MREEFAKAIIEQAAEPADAAILDGGRPMNDCEASVIDGI